MRPWERIGIMQKYFIGIKKVMKYLRQELIKILIMSGLIRWHIKRKISWGIHLKMQFFLNAFLRMSI